MAERSLFELNDAELEAAAEHATVLGREYFGLTKNLPSAHLARTEAVALLRERLRRNPESAPGRLALAQALNELAVTAEDESGSDANAQISAEAVDLLRDMVATGHCLPDSRQALIRALSELAEARFCLHQYDDAYAAIIEAITVAISPMAGMTSSASELEPIKTAARVFFTWELHETDAAKALVALETCLSLFCPHWAKAGADPVETRTVAEFLNAKVSIHEDLDQEDEAQAARIERAAMLRLLVEAAPDDDDTLEDLSQLLIEIGDDESAQGNHANALKYGMEADAALDRRSPSPGYEWLLHYDRSKQRMLLGDAERGLDRTNAARTAYREAISIRRALLEDDHVPYGNNAMLVDAISLLSDLERAEGDLAAATAAWRDVVDPLAPTWPDFVKPLGKRTIIGACDGLAFLARERGDPVTAYGLHAQALTLEREWATSSRRNAPSLRKLAVALDNLADDVWALSGSDAAYDLLTERVEVIREWQRCAEHARDARRAQTQLTWALDDLGRAEWNRSEYARTHVLQSERVAIYRERAALETSNPKNQRLLGLALGSLGEVAAKLEQHAAAIECLQECAALLRAFLTTADPVESRDDLLQLIAVERAICRSAWKLGDHDTALAAARARVAACQLDVSRHEADTPALRRLYFAFRKLGTYARDAGKSPAAREAWREAHAVIALLRLHGPDELDDFDPDAHERQLADDLDALGDDQDPGYMIH